MLLPAGSPCEVTLLPAMRSVEFARKVNELAMNGIGWLLPPFDTTPIELFSTAMRDRAPSTMGVVSKMAMRTTRR